MIVPGSSCQGCRSSRSCIRPSCSASALDPSLPIQPQMRQAGVWRVRDSPTISQISTTCEDTNVCSHPGQVLRCSLSDGPSARGGRDTTGRKEPRRPRERGTTGLPGPSRAGGKGACPMVTANRGVGAGTTRRLSSGLRDGIGEWARECRDSEVGQRRRPRDRMPSLQGFCPPVAQSSRLFA